MLPLPQLDSKHEDVIFKMNFNATNHTIKMYNRIYVSTRALQLANIDPTSQQDVGIWMQGIYQAYSKLRDITLKDGDFSKDKLTSLLEGYCEVLKKDNCIQDYWVTIYNGTKKELDSKLLRL